jgi:hypothetical protein
MKLQVKALGLIKLEFKLKGHLRSSWSENRVINFETYFQI